MICTRTLEFVDRTIATHLELMSVYAKCSTLLSRSLPSPAASPTILSPARGSRNWWETLATTGRSPRSPDRAVVFIHRCRRRLRGCRPPCAMMSTASARIWVISLLLVPILTACGGGGGQPLDADEAGLTRREILGKRLFFDTSLSEPPGQGCASCHDPELAFSGNNGSSSGVALGADGRSLGLRNTPSAMYARFAPSFAMVDSEGGRIPIGGQFLDGRAASLEDQAGQPFFSREEMNVPSAAALAEKVSAAGYAMLMREEFGSNVFDDPAAALEAIKAAIAAFERTDRFAPFSSKYDHVVAGRAQFSELEKRGLSLFLDPEKGNCAACHVADPSSRNPADSLFTDFTYDNLGVPRNTRIPANADAAFFDLGLCAPKRTAPEADTALCGAFKVPTLRNVAKRQALMHNGFFTNLRDAVAFYATRDTDPGRWYPKGVPFDDLPPEWRANVNRGEVPYDRGFGDVPRIDDAEIDALVAFLGTLNDGYGASLASEVPRTGKRADAPALSAAGAKRSSKIR